MRGTSTIATTVHAGGEDAPEAHIENEAGRGQRTKDPRTQMQTSSRGRSGEAREKDLPHIRVPARFRGYRGTGFVAPTGDLQAAGSNGWGKEDWTRAGDVLTRLVEH